MHIDDRQDAFGKLAGDLLELDERRSVEAGVADLVSEAEQGFDSGC